MRIKASKLLAAVLALCLTLGTAPAASAAALPQSAPGSQDITPYFLYIKGQDCILDISGRTAYINAWVSGQTSVATKCKVRAELQEKSGTYAWTTVDFWTDQQNGTWAEVDETAAVTPAVFTSANHSGRSSLAVSTVTARVCFAATCTSFWVLEE